MSAPLFLFLCLLHFKSALSLGIPLFSADLSTFRFHFFSLFLKSLLRFRAYTGVLQLLSGVPASSFGVVAACLVSASMAGLNVSS
jgi:hypothetical protein